MATGRKWFSDVTENSDDSHHARLEKAKDEAFKYFGKTPKSGK